MKSLRTSRCTENRNARKEVVARGGSRGTGSPATLTADKELVYERTRRVLRNKRSQATVIALSKDGVLFPPIVPTALAPFTRAILKARFS